MLFSTQVEVVVELTLELSLAIAFRDIWVLVLLTLRCAIYIFLSIHISLISLHYLLSLLDLALSLKSQVSRATDVLPCLLYFE